jgi:opacity protein-like surface antigen
LFKEENGQYEHKGLFDTVLTDHKSENSQRFTEVKLHYLYNIKANNIIGLFLGAGPIFNYTYTVENRNRLVYIDTLTVNEYSGTSEKKWNIGITVLAGLECLIYQNISLFAEYESTFTWGKRNYDNGFTNQSYEYDLRGYEIIGLKMGLSIYF